MIIIGIILFLIVLVIVISYICFRMAFYVPAIRKADTEEYPIPEGDIYEPWRDVMMEWIKQTRALPHREFFIKSFDGLTLRGNYYEFAPGAPVELMLHGYRGAADRDLCGGVQRCFALGHSALVVDQRCCGGSEGTVITFGLYESRDCLQWLNFLLQEFGADTKVILTGISMGASSVLMAAGQPLPPQVIGVLADCGYTSAKEIIKVVIRQMKLPPKLSYPFVRLGALLFGRFDPNQASAIDALDSCNVPVIFYHGGSDDFVPCYMSEQNYQACPSKKKLVIIPGAGHGLAYLVDPKVYLSELATFFNDNT